MSSWSSSYPPPPRRSRSRSPRGGYSSGRPPYPDTYPDPYNSRPDWDSYDRDRWAYERDRAPYDYGRRGRSRSPPLDEGWSFHNSSSILTNVVEQVGGNGDGQCPLTTGRDTTRGPDTVTTTVCHLPSFFHFPRVSHSFCLDAHSRHGYTSPRRHAAPYGSSRRAPPDPHTLEYPASLKQYAEWFRYYYPTQATEEDQADKAAEHQAGDGSKPRNGIKSKWEKYKKDFAATQVSVLLFIDPLPSCCRPQSCVVFTVVSFLFIVESNC